MHTRPYRQGLSYLLRGLDSDDPGAVNRVVVVDGVIVGGLRDVRVGHEALHSRHLELAGHNLRPLQRCPHTTSQRCRIRWHGKNRRRVRQSNQCLSLVRYAGINIEG